MSKKYNVLIVDDHPLIVDAYKNALIHVSKNNAHLQFEIATANSCDSALEKFTHYSKNTPLDLVFLDIKLPKSEDGKILSGEDLGVAIRDQFDATKIIIATTFNDNFLIYNVFKTINPEGFLVKNDLTPTELVSAIKAVLEDPPYYSRTVVKLLQKHLMNDFVLDKHDRQLLYELSIGTKMKDLPNILPFSIAGIERRKRQLKEMFNVSKKDDKALIQEAKERGFL